MKTFYDLFKSIAIAIALAVPVTASAADIGAEFTDNGIKYEIITEAEVAVVPNGYDGYPGKITIPASVTYENVQYAVTATNSDKYTSEYMGVFGPSTTKVSFPEGLVSLGYCTFEMAAIEEVTLPSSLTTLAAGTFFNLPKLTSVTIPDKVEVIPNSCFMGCTVLTEITLGKGVKQIGKGSLNGGFSLSVLRVNATTPPVIDEYAFGTTKNDDDENVPLQPSIVTLVVPVGCIAAYREAWSAFDFRAIIEDGQEIPDPGETEFEVNGFKYEKLNDTDVALIACTVDNTNVTVPATVNYENTEDNVTTIGSGFDQVFSKATNVTLSNGITTIETYAFINSPVTSITLPYTLSTIKQGAFRQSKITEITIPSNVTQIPDRCFMGCNALTEITLGSGITDIGINAFMTCNKLSTIHLRSDVPPTLDPTSFDSRKEEVLVYVPIGRKSAYKEAWGEYGFKEILEEGEKPGSSVIINKIAADDITYVVTGDGIQLSRNIDSNAAIYSITGQLLVNSGCTDGFIPARLPAGVYLLRIGDTTLKILVK